MSHSQGPVSLKTLAEEQAKRVQAQIRGAPLPDSRSAKLTFGDGDGSFWDRWLAAPQPTVSSFRSGFKKPKFGFKKTDQAIKDEQARARKARRDSWMRSKERRQGDEEDDLMSPSSTSAYVFQRDSSDSDHDAVWDSLTDESEPEFVGHGDDNGAGKNSSTSLMLPPIDLKGQATTPKDGQRRKVVDVFSPRSRKYVGPVARRRFFKKFQREWKSQNKTIILSSSQSTPSLVPERQTSLMPHRLTNIGSAREKFLQRCAIDQIPPQPAIIRRFKSSELSLSGLSLGDEVGSALAEALPNLPNLEELDLSNNRLTSHSVSRTLGALRLSSLDILVSINLSGNKLGQRGFAALVAFLSETRVLSSLELEHTRAGDPEAELLCNGLMKNETLTELNVANNLFAEASGHSFARMMRRKPSEEDRELVRRVPLGDGTFQQEAYVEVPSKCKLETLDLSWNQIRKTGATAIGRAFLFNDTLHTLDLSYCAFGDSGTMVVMDSLRTNTTLTWLELDNNAIKGRGAMVIASSLEHNTTLKYLQLWENPLGKAGGRALLRSVSRTGAVREIQLDKCNFEIEEDGLFDPEYPPSKVNLDLDDLYQRSVAEEIVRILETKPNMQVKRFLLDGNPVSYEQRQPDELPGYVSGDEGSGFDDSDTDSDSGSDPDAEADDGANDKMKETKTKTKAKNRKQKSPIDPYDTSNLLFRLANERQFEVPDTGQFVPECDVKPRIAPKSCVKMSSAGIKGLLSIILGGGPSTSRKDRMMRLRNAMYDAHITSRQGKRILKKIKSREERIEAMELLLPRLLDPENKFLLLSQCLEEKDISTLASQMGASFDFSPSNPTGHYELNLEEPNDRELAAKIFQIDVENMRWAAEKSERGDTSQQQLGSFSGFRNAIFRGRGVVLEPSGRWWNEKLGAEEAGALLPPGGFLEFDYVHARTPSRRMRRLRPTAAQFEMMCDTLGLFPGCTFEKKATTLGFSSTAAVLGLLSQSLNRKNLKSMGPGKAKRNAAAMVLQNWCRVVVSAHRTSIVAVDEEVVKVVEAPLNRESAATRLQRWYGKLRHKWGFEEGLPPSTIMNSAGGGILGLVRKALKRQTILDQAKAKRVRQNGLLPLRRTVGRMFLTCKQVAHVMSCFPRDQPSHARVRVLQACFSRIVDLENLFPHIMSWPGLLRRKKYNPEKNSKQRPTEAPRDDYEEAVHCLGWLNLFNPRDPDWTFDLDHAQPDHLALSKILIKLADVEPGENFVNETWTKWDKQAVDPETGEKGCFVTMPGWQLPESWLDPEKIPDIGFLHFTYYSGRDSSQGTERDPRGPLVGLEGCDPIWDLRQEFVGHVLMGNKKC